MKRFQMLTIAMLFVGALAGCGAADGDRVQVQGEVTLNGAPLESGVISFLPVDGRGGTAGANIQNGKYTADIEPGAKRVSIVAEKKTGQAPRDPANPGGEQIDIMQQILPPQYNDQSTLTLEVPAEGKKDANFQLTGAKP